MISKSHWGTACEKSKVQISIYISNKNMEINDKNNYQCTLQFLSLKSIHWSYQWQTGMCLGKPVLQFIFVATSGTSAFRQD